MKTFEEVYKKARMVLRVLSKLLKILKSLSKQLKILEWVGAGFSGPRGFRNHHLSVEGKGRVLRCGNFRSTTRHALSRLSDSSAVMISRLWVLKIVETGL